MKEEKSPHSRKLPQVYLWGILESQRATKSGEGKKKKDTTNRNCREVAQSLTSTTSEWGLGREAWTASLVLRVRTAPEDMRVPQCSLQHCVQQLGHGSNLYVHQQMNG